MGGQTTVPSLLDIMQQSGKEMAGALTGAATQAGQQLEQAGKSTTDYLKGAGEATSKYLGETGKSITDYYSGVGKSISGAAKAQLPGIKAAAGTAATKGKALAGILETKDNPNAVITDVQRSKEQNRALKNPLQGVGFDARSQAIGGKLERLYATPEYQKLSAEGKVRVRNDVYDKYVVPTFKEAGRNPPSREEWLMHTRSEIADYSKSGVLPETISSTTAGALGITIAGAKYARRTWAQVSGLADFFHGDTAGDLEASWAKGQEQANKSLVGRAVNSLEAGLDEVNFFTNSRPRDTLLSSAAVWGGEQVATLPIYGAVGKGLEAVKLAEGSVGLLGKVAPNLTKTLEASPTGRWVGRRLFNAADGYLSSRAIGQSHQEGVEGAVGFAAFGAAAEPIGAVLKTGWEAAAKKFTANNIAMGGKQLQAEITDSVIAEMKGQHTVATEDVVNRKVHDAEKDILNTISEKENKKSFNEATKEEQDKVVEERARIAEHAAAELPIHEPGLVQREVQQSIESWNKSNPDSDAITKQLQALGRDVAKDNAAEIAHATEVQTGLLNPEKAAAKVAKAGTEVAGAEAPAGVFETTKQRKAREKLEARAQARKDYEELKREQREDKLRNMTPEQREKYEMQQEVDKWTPGSTTKSEAAEYEPKEGESARLTPEMLGVSIKDTRAFYKNPTSKLDKMGRLIGARDQRSIGQRIQDTHTERFMELLKDIDGGKIKFEKEKDRLLWHWGFREHMSPQMKRALRLQLTHAYKDAATGLAEDTKSLDRRHQRVMTHLKMLLETGKLRTERNVFRSTKTSGRGTPWQLQLRKEHAELTDKQIALNVKKHKGGYQALNAVKSLLKGTE